MFFQNVGTNLQEYIITEKMTTLQGCEMLRIPHCPDNWFTDDG
jgi:hypothetical protein